MGRASIAGLLETEKSPPTTCDWVFPWCFLAKLSASPLPAAAEGFKCEGIAREAIVSESVESGKIGFKLESVTKRGKARQGACLARKSRFLVCAAAYLTRDAGYREIPSQAIRRLLNGKVWVKVVFRAQKSGGVVSYIKLLSLEQLAVRDLSTCLARATSGHESDELRISLYRLPPFISRGRSHAGLLPVGDLITQEVSQCI